MDDEFRGPISGNLHVPTSAAGLWGGSWTGATAGATHRGAGPTELCGGTAWGTEISRVKMVPRSGSLQRVALH